MKREIYTLAAISGVLLLYVGLYFLLVSKGPAGPYSEIPPWEIPAEYQFGGAVSEFIFKPIHTIDTRIKHDYWHFKGYRIEPFKSIEDIRKSLEQTTHPSSMNAQGNLPQ